MTAFTTSNASKSAIVESLALAFERCDIQIPDDKHLVGELLVFRASKTVMDLTRYSAPDGGHDDLVMACCLGWGGVDGSIPAPSRPRAMWINSMEDCERPSMEQWLNNRGRLRGQVEGSS